MLNKILLRPIAVLSLSFCLGLAASPAQAEEGFFKSLFEAAGFAAPEPTPPDFVVKARPAKREDYIPVFQPPGEPPGAIKKPADVETLRSSLESSNAAHDALRAGFPPALKAVAEAKTAKAKKKKIPDAATPQ